MINVKKSSEPKGKFKYTDKVIKEKVKIDFFNLCYLCEERELRHSEIDHFYPKGEKYFPEKINNWNNLFLICEKCNKVRPKNINSVKNEEVYNNCVDDVESLISLSYDFEADQVKIESLENTVKSRNTVKLLERIYNGRGSQSPDYLELQKEIKNKTSYFQQAIDNYFNVKVEQLKDNYRNIVIDFISKKYNLNEKVDYNKVGFVSFKRNIINNNSKYHEFKNSFD